ncbi:MAG: VPLPA-CTERM sorting domain-containing protein [Gammaproteobacteria bacterium]
MDVDYAGGADPFLEFQDGALVSINLLFTSGTNGANADFSSSGILFGSGSVLSGLWDVNSFNTTVVPVPAAVWLFGSGLIGLAGVARRKQNRA